MAVVVGPIADRRDEIIARVAGLLHVAGDDEWVAAAVDQATEFAIIKTNREEIGLPDEALVVGGLIVFAQRMYTNSPFGAQVAIGDASFEPIFQPENLWKGVRHYFIHLAIAFPGPLMNVADLVKLIGDGLVEAGQTKVPVVLPGTSVSVIPCVVLAPADDQLASGNRTLRYGFDITVIVHRNNQVGQYELLTDLEAIVLQSLTQSQVQFEGPITFASTGGEATGEPPALARVIPITFASDVDLCP